MSNRLSPLDAAFLELEENDSVAHMHIGSALIFEPLPGGGAPSLERLRDQVRERLAPLPRFRRNLSSPRVRPLSLPSWEADPDLDPGELVRRAVLPAPGGEAELMEWLGDFFSHRLDRSRPLWETTLLEGLEGGRWALVTKVHHCLIDGIEHAGGSLRRGRAGGAGAGNGREAAGRGWWRGPGRAWRRPAPSQCLR
jgi:hypothetical protein